MSKLLTYSQRRWLSYRTLKIGGIYILPRWGFRVYARPNEVGRWLDLNPFTKVLDKPIVTLIEMRDNFSRVRFIESQRDCPEFWIENFDLECRGLTESLFLKTVFLMPFLIYNLGVLIKKKLEGSGE